MIYRDQARFKAIFGVKDKMLFDQLAEGRRSGSSSSRETLIYSAPLGYQRRRDRFLAEIEVVTPWAELERTIIPFYPSSGGRGRPPIGLARMLRMYVAQQCFGLSDEGVEDALYDSQAIRRFVGIDLAREAAPDATTLLKFRRLLEAHQLTESIFNAINAHLAEKGLLLREGTIVDATLIAAPPSTKNREGKRDEEMHQAKKGNQWHFGMKAHIGVDAQSGLVLRCWALPPT